MAVSKYAGHLPLYRQCQIYKCGGVDLDRSTLASWCGTAAYHLAPVVDRMLVHLKRSGRLFMDETRTPVLDPGVGKTKTGYLWALTRGDRGWGGGILRRSCSLMLPGAAGIDGVMALAGVKGAINGDAGDLLIRRDLAD